MQAVVKKLGQLEDQKADVEKRLAEAEQKAANPLSGAWDEQQTLIDALDTKAHAKTESYALVKQIKDELAA